MAMTSGSGNLFPRLLVPALSLSLRCMRRLTGPMSGGRSLPRGHCLSEPKCPRGLVVSLCAMTHFRIFSDSSAPMGESVQVAPPVSSPPKSKDRPPSRPPQWQAVALLLLIGWLYASILARLFLQWVGPHSDPNFQHGIFVPLFALFVLWQDRDKLKTIAPAASWSGLSLVVLSLLVLVLGVRGADIFLPRVSLLILLAGLIILFRGWTFFRAVLFPWAFLILMIPIPALIINRVTFPLQLLAARLSAALLGLVVVVHREGNIIWIPSGPLDVAEA